MALKPTTVAVTVTTAGTRVQVSASSLICEWARFESAAGIIYVGGSSVSSTAYMAKLAAGVGYDLKNPGQSTMAGNLQSFDLKNFWVDASTNTQVVMVTYFQRIGND